MNANAANAVTCARIAMSPFLVFADPHSWTFVALFLLCGLTDILDGWLARKFRIESEFGGKLDSVADFIMFAALVYVLIRNVEIPAVVCALVVLTFAVKTLSFAIGKRKGFFGFRHSVFNKITGIMVFFSIPLFLYWEPLPTGIAVCVVALFAALDELSANLHEEKIVSKNAAR